MTRAARNPLTAGARSPSSTHGRSRRFSRQTRHPARRPRETRPASRSGSSSCSSRLHPRSPLPAPSSPCASPTAWPGGRSTMEVVSETGGPVAASNGVVVEADAGLVELGARRRHRRRRADGEAGDHPAGPDLAPPRGAAGMAIGAVCTGAQVIAQAGLLDGPALHHPLGVPRQLRGGFPRDRPPPNVYVIDRDR